MLAEHPKRICFKLFWSRRRPPTASWGNMINAANSLIDFQKRPWLWIPPGVAIFMTVISINLLGDGLRDAIDPNMKRR